MAPGQGQLETVQKLAKTISIALCWICLGLMTEISGTTLIDLKARTKSSYEEVATAISGLSIGYTIGSILGGALIDKLGLFLELMMALSLNVLAVATIGIPWVPRTELIWVLCCIQGVGGGVLNTSGMKMILNMWLTKAASPMHMVHGGYGIGSFLIPLIANPFLAVPKTKHHNDTEISMAHFLDVNSSFARNTSISTDAFTEEQQYLKPSRIEIAYLIPAVISICLSFVFYAYHFTANKERHQHLELHLQSGSQNKSLEFKHMLNPATCTGGDVIYGLQVFIFLFLYYFNCVGPERVNGAFLRAYSIDHLGFSVDDGSYINTSFWISHTVGRYVGFLVARWIPIRILVLIESGGLLISAICHASLSGRSAIALWIIIQPMGFFTGPLFPSGIGWGNFHVKMTGSAVAVLQLGACVGSFAYLKLIGFLYDTCGTQTFLYTLLGNGIVMLLIVILLDMTDILHGRK